MPSLPSTDGSVRLANVKISVRLRQGDWGWLLIVGGVVAIDLAVKEGETLSEAADRYLECRPVLTHAVALVTVAHILNWLRPEVDPYSIGFAWVRRRLGRTPDALDVELAAMLATTAID